MKIFNLILRYCRNRLCLTAAAVFVLLWAVIHALVLLNAPVLPAFPEAQEGRPSYVMQLNRAASPELIDYEGRDFAYRIGEPVLVTLFVRPQGTSLDLANVAVKGNLPEVRRTVVAPMQGASWSSEVWAALLITAGGLTCVWLVHRLRHGESLRRRYLLAPLSVAMLAGGGYLANAAVREGTRDDTGTVRLEFRLQSMELPPKWTGNIDVPYEVDGNERILSVPFEVYTASLDDGRKLNHPVEAPLMMRSSTPSMVLGIGLTAFGLATMVSGGWLLLGGKRKRKVKPPKLLTKSQAWQALTQQVKEHLAAIVTGTGGLSHYDAIAAALRQWYGIQSWSAQTIRHSNDQTLFFGVGGAVANVIDICDRAVNSQTRPHSQRVEELTVALVQIFGFEVKPRPTRR